VIPSVASVADDEHENREILRGLLEPLGFRVREAEPPDLVLMDLRMPGMDGRRPCAPCGRTPRFETRGRRARNSALSGLSARRGAGAPVGANLREVGSCVVLDINDHRDNDRRAFGQHGI
jgi:CheY-like chemotaxis protein